MNGMRLAVTAMALLGVLLAPAPVRAQLPPAPLAFCQITSPRKSRPRSSWRMEMTSAERERYGLRPRLATFTAIRPPLSSLRAQMSSTSPSNPRYSA
jgi:hypothetical protein